MLMRAMIVLVLLLLLLAWLSFQSALRHCSAHVRSSLHSYVRTITSRAGVSNHAHTGAHDDDDLSSGQ
jgi:hypothetical protein